jgi:hypothetical protein
MITHPACCASRAHALLVPGLTGRAQQIDPSQIPKNYFLTTLSVRNGFKTCACVNIQSNLVACLAFGCGVTRIWN